MEPTTINLLILRGERHTSTNLLSVVLSHNLLGLRSVAPPFRDTWRVQQHHARTPLPVENLTTAPWLTSLGPKSAHGYLKYADSAGLPIPNVPQQQAGREPLMCCWKHGYASDECVPTAMQVPTRETTSDTGLLTRMYMAPPPPVAASFVLLVRTPYAWLPSMWLCPYDLLGGVGSFGDWLRRPFPFVADPYVPARSCNATAAARAPTVETSSAGFSRSHSKGTGRHEWPLMQATTPQAARRRRRLSQGEQQQHHHHHHHHHANPVALWTAKTASYLSLRAPKVIVTDDDIHNASRLEASLRSLGLALRGPSLSLPLLPRLPPGTNPASAKWLGHFTESGYAAEAARAASRDWLRYYTQADLDAVNSQLDASRGAEQMRALRMPRVLALLGGGSGGGDGGGALRLYCGARANCTARRYGGCAPMCQNARMLAVGPMLVGAPTCTESPHPRVNFNCSVCLTRHTSCAICIKGGHDCHCSCREAAELLLPVESEADRPELAAPLMGSTAPLRDAALAQPWLTSRAVSEQLPSISVQDILRHQRRRPRAHLSQCINIAIAGTGSTTLASWLQQRSIHAQHNHVLDTWDKLLHWDKLQGSPHPPRCAIVTLRDPARRLESGVRYELFETHRHIGPLASEAGRFLHPTNARATQTRELIDCLERCANDPSNGTTPKATGCDRPCSAAGRGMLRLYQASAAVHSWPNGMSVLGLSGPTSGSFFLISQLEYLRGLDLLNDSAPDVHFLCTERMGEMWESLVSRIGRFAGDPSDVGIAKLGSAQNRSASSKATMVVRPDQYQRMLNNTRLDARTEAFVRESMFPWDTRLYEAVCGRGAGSISPPRL